MGNDWLDDVDFFGEAVVEPEDPEETYREMMTRNESDVRSAFNVGVLGTEVGSAAAPSMTDEDRFDFMKKIMDASAKSLSEEMDAIAIEAMRTTTPDRVIPPESGLVGHHKSPSRPISRPLALPDPCRYKGDHETPNDSAERSAKATGIIGNLFAASWRNALEKGNRWGR